MDPEVAALKQRFGVGLEQLAQTLTATSRRARLGMAVVPTRFVDFCEWVGVTLSRAQRVVGLVAYDGVEPKDLPPEDREIARQMFGDIDVVPASARHVVVEVCGARAGKTYIFESLRLLHLALTVPVKLGAGERANAVIIEPDIELAQQAINYVVGTVEGHPELLGMVAHKTPLSITLRRPDGIKVVIVCRAASSRGRTARGRTLVAAAMGEAAFFRDANYQVNDDEIFQALVPRVVSQGQIIISSTPFAMSGLLYSMFAANHPAPLVAGVPTAPLNQGTALAVHAPTLLLRDDDEELRERVEREYKRDVDNAEREYGARFMSSGTSLFFDAAAINAAIKDVSMPLQPEAGDQVMAGGDLGFEKNSSTLAIVYKRGSRYLTADLYERKPIAGQPLAPSEVVKDFVLSMQMHGAKHFMADRHYRATVWEHLKGTGIAAVDAPNDPSEAFVRVNALLREGLVDVPNHPRLLQQLRETIARPRPGGGTTIILPSWRTGEHGDLAAAWVLAIYQSTGRLVPAEVAKQGTSTWEEQQRANRAKGMLKKEAVAMVENVSDDWARKVAFMRAHHVESAEWAPDGSLLKCHLFEEPAPKREPDQKRPPPTREQQILQGGSSLRVSKQ